MNINDPFGRLQKQREKEYQSLSNTLRDSGVDNRRDAEKLQETLLRRGKMGILFLIPITLMLAALLPEFHIFIIVIGALIGTWLFKTTTRSRAYIKRFIEEELSQDGDKKEF